MLVLLPHTATLLVAEPANNRVGMYHAATMEFKV
jgi:hypothetical protein